jgi:hypothetical protein
VELAAKLLGEGKRVELNQPREISTLLDRLAALAKEAHEKGEAAPTFDLCKVSVKGTNLFCVESKGIPRTQMPQLKGTPLPGSKADQLPKTEKGRIALDNEFVAHLRSKGIPVTHEQEQASYLRASQREMNGANVARIMGEIERGRKTVPIFVSADNYIIDGHHNWAAVVGADSRDGTLDVEMPVLRIGMQSTEVLEEARKFAADWGLPQMSMMVEAARRQPSGYLAETERIRENKRRSEASQAHPFRKARWTHPNGHPRCLSCGGEEPIGGRCNSEPSKADREAFFDRRQAEIEEAFDPTQPRDPHGRWTAMAGQLADSLRMFGTMTASSTADAVKAGRLKYHSYYDFVLQHGQLFHHGEGVTPTEREFTATTPNECFSNALLAAVQHKDLTYVEGYASNGIMPIHHAWVVGPGWW